MEVRPATVRFIAHSPEMHFGRYLRVALDVLGKTSPGFGPWEARSLKLKGEGFPQAVLDRLSDPAVAFAEPAFVELTIEAGAVVTLRPIASGPRPYCETRIVRTVSSGDTKESLLAFMNDAAQICRGLLSDTSAYWAKLVPVAGGATCIPSPPLVEHNSHIAVVTDAEIARHYASVRAFLESGFETVERFGDRKLLLRGMGAVCGPEYLEQIIDQQWALARAALPKQTRYALPQPEPSELSIFRRGAGRLEFVGYVASEATVEYSCVLGRGQHISGWEIYGLWDLVQEGRTREGHEVKGVRVVFLDAWAAQQEKRPLLDVGCRVYHYGEDGELHELTE